MPPTLSAGSIAELVDLASRPDLNGEKVELLGWMSSRRRWCCRHKEGSLLNIQSKNLRPFEEAESWHAVAQQPAEAAEEHLVAAHNDQAGLANVPQLGPGLKTFVINLARRPDRRASIEALCRDLQLEYEIIEAVDGRALAAQPGAHLELVPTQREHERSRLRLIGSAVKPRGFQAIRSRTWRTRFERDGRQCEQLLQMAQHRLKASALTEQGHELWGAVGCSLSHQIILRKITESPDLEYALVLEDDCALGFASADEVRQIFNDEMREIARSYPDWQLVYLGGSISSYIRKEERDAWKITDFVKKAKQVYQTHAFVIRRGLVPLIQAKLERGLAADAALVSWSREAANDDSPSCFLFHPQGLLVQPGGAQRWKDSDIFVEGEFFKRQVQSNTGGAYDFAVASRTRRPPAVDVTREELRGWSFSSGEEEPPGTEEAPRPSSRPPPQEEVDPPIPPKVPKSPPEAHAPLRTLMEDPHFQKAVLARGYREADFPLPEAALEVPSQLREKLGELAAGTASFADWVRSARRHASTTIQDVLPRLRATVRYLSSNTGVQVPSRSKLAAAVRCIAEFCHDFSEDEARQCEASLLRRPSKASSGALLQLEAFLLPNEGELELEPGPALAAEAPLLFELVKQEQAAQHQARAVRRVAAVAGVLPMRSSAVDGVTTVAPLTPAPLTPVPLTPVPGLVPATPPFGAAPTTPLTGSPAPPSAKRPAQEDAEVKPDPSPPLPKRRRGVLRPCKDSYEELRKLSIAQLREKARLCQANIWSCLEKEEVVQAILQTGRTPPAPMARSSRPKSHPAGSAPKL
ncbi:TY5A [Symbiodinium sp. CCMP2592]|nr:TY5A [Symbiodinium sp. CCMP2592]